MFKKIMALGLVSALSITAAQQLTINIKTKGNRGNQCCVRYSQNTKNIECAHCGKDITSEQFYIVACQEYGPYALFLCTKCNKEYEEIEAEETEETTANEH
jgi:DNA-directed RNA polymerase subunit RPC12/RpoP